MGINQLKGLKLEEFVKIREMLSDRETWDIIDFDYFVNNEKDNNISYGIMYKNKKTNEYMVLKYDTSRGYNNIYFYHVNYDEKGENYDFNLSKTKTC